MKRITQVSAVLSLMVSFSIYAKPVVEMYKSPSCTCCEEWANIMQNKGYNVELQPTNNWHNVKKSFGMPSKLVSCHTAVIDGYMIEGHVPEKDIAKLLAEKPSDIVGLSAPGMPQHSPGMAAPGQAYQGFDVIAFDRSGATRNFSLY
ncbi:CopG family transcriptional regulator [Vibrio sp. S4M6]|uniref:DUF411 domain-containing protein n=1 Tax=Vibrio sinus TaxID=2946865 RepID=UPI00202A3BDD|nr:DUF411 domain-containing protein [Vibrio sinus]MCL9779940.1 CopG family transcriptional regulator [Vibrio sinus]